MRRKIGHDGKEETVDVQAAMAVDPSGRVGEPDGTGGTAAVAPRSETIQEHFFRCVENGIEPLTPASDGRETLRTVMALWEPQRTGGVVEVGALRR